MMSGIEWLQTVFLPTAFYWVIVGGGFLALIAWAVISFVSGEAEEREIARHVAKTKASNARLKENSRAATHRRRP